MARTPFSPRKVDVDAIRASLDADAALLLVPVTYDRYRVAARAGALDVPDEILAPHGSLLARIVSGLHPERVPRLPLISGTAARSRSFGPSLVVPAPLPGFGTGLLIVARKQPARAFEEAELERARALAATAAQPSPGLSLLDLDTLGGDATFREAFEVSAVGMSLVDPALRFRWVNGPLCDMLGRGRSELLGTPVTDTVHPDHLDRLTAFYERLRGGEHHVRDRVRFQRPDGVTVWADVGGSVIETAPRSPLFLVQQFDVTAEQEVTDVLAHRAMHDEMTGLASRALLRDRLHALLARSVRGGSRAAVLFLDLDEFKAINDTWGHAVGDAVITETSRRIAAVVRAGDTVARFGGDEFVVAGEVSGPHEASQLATRIGVALRPPVDVGGGRKIAVSASIGVALSRPLDMPDDLVARADVSLLEAKRLRRLHLVADDAAVPAPDGAAAGIADVLDNDVPAPDEGVVVVAGVAAVPEADDGELRIGPA
jgi:diguanylate cyclase (GGDEF)-like protein/PAS domain S-box-containing protein